MDLTDKIYEASNTPEINASAYNAFLLTKNYKNKNSQLVIGPDYDKTSDLVYRSIINPVATHVIIYEVLGADVTINLVQE